jgi:hypothetical protein
LNRLASPRDHASIVPLRTISRVAGQPHRRGRRPALAGCGLRHLAAKNHLRAAGGPGLAAAGLQHAKAAAKSTRESQAQLKYEHDFARDGRSFDRLSRAHPRATDEELKQAIIAAVKFDDDCFRYSSYGRAEDYWEICIRAVEHAAKDNPPYLKTTYRDARNRVAFLHEVRGHFPRQWIACLCGAETPIDKMLKAHKQNDAGHAAEGRFKPAPPRQENP